MKKAARIAGISLVALLLTAALFVAWVLHTESGLRSGLALARGWLPAGLTIGEVQGTLGSTLRLRNFHYRDAAAGVDIRIESAELEFSVFALLSRRLRVQRALADGLRFELFAPTAPSQPASAAGNPWVAPLDMRIEELRLTRAQLLRANAAPLVIDRAHLAGSWTGANIQAQTLEVEGPDGAATLELRITERAPKLELLRGHFRWRIGENFWAGTLDAAGGSDDLRFKANLEAPVTTAVTGNLAFTQQQGALATWRAHLAVARFDPHPLLETDAFKTVALELDANGDTTSAVLQGVLSLDDERIHIERLAATQRDDLLQVTALLLRLNSQPAVLSGTASIPFAGLAADGSNAASAQLKWDEFQLPDAWMGPQFRSSGQLALSAVAQRFAVNGSARLARGAQRSTLTLRLDGSSRALRIQEFELTQARGALSVTGNVDLAPPARWQLDARAREFDPSLFLDDWPGALNFELHTTGEWPESGPHARLNLARLDGRLRGRAISGAVDITLGPDRKPAGNLQLRSASASFQAVASAGPRPRVDATLKVGMLQEWHPRLSGALDAQMTALGRWPDVELDAQLSANRFRNGETRIDAARAHLTARHARAPAGRLDLDATGLRLAGMDFDSVELKFEGDAGRHALDLDARGTTLSLALHAAGGYQRATWSGVIDKLGVTVAPVPALSLTQPSRLVVARSHFELGTTCLVNGEISLCAGARHDGGELSANYSIKALPLGMLTALVAPGTPITVDGLLEGGGDLHRTANGKISGKAALASPRGVIVQGTNKPGEEALRIEYREFGIDVDLSPAAANARLRGKLLNQGDVAGTLAVAVAEPDPTLAGAASVQLQDLAPLGWWIPQLANLRGSGEIGAQISGTMATPRFALTLRGKGLDAEVPVLGVHLREGNVDATLEPAGAFQARGSLASGDGTVSLSGSRNADQEMELKIAGDNFLAANIPGARVVIAPDLALSGKIGDLALTGTVRIDDAEVNLDKLSISHSYSTSPDVVVVDRELEVKERSPGLSTDVRVLFGEHVKLSGFGLDSTVKGELRVYEGKDAPSRATGEVRLAGTYEAFGRKLNIERGRLMFAGSALDDPQLDILAVRKLQDVTAKLSVTGTAQHPKLDVFTDPASSQTDAMSYLLTGKPASDLKGEDGAVVQSAAQNAGMLLGNRLAKKLGGKMGLVDEIGVEQNVDLGGSAFTVGKYLSPKLFVSYGVGLFEPGNSVTVRYEISEKWSLEAKDTPEDQHAGVRYRIEK